MTNYGITKRIKTVEDMVNVMDDIMYGMETREFTHQYYQVLAIHNEVDSIEKRMDRLEDKMDKVLGRLTYLCAADNEKKFMYPTGETNYDAIKEMCEDVQKDMKEMRDE